MGNNFEKGKDESLCDTENVPLVQDIDRCFEREVLPYIEEISPQIDFK